MTSKGQITIPRAIREHMGLRPGDEIEFVEKPCGMHVRRDPEALRKALEKWRGYLTELAGQDVDELIEEMRGR